MKRGPLSQLDRRFEKIRSLPKKERTVDAPPEDWLTAAGASFFGNVPGERHDSDRQERVNLFILNHYLFAASEAVGAPTKEGYKRRATDYNIGRQ